MHIKSLIICAPPSIEITLRSIKYKKNIIVTTHIVFKITTILFVFRGSLHSQTFVFVPFSLSLFGAIFLFLSDWISLYSGRSMLKKKFEDFKRISLFLFVVSLKFTFLSFIFFEIFEESSLINLINYF